LVEIINKQKRKRKWMYNGKVKTYFRGGIRRLAAGLMPFSNAFLACIIKCLVGDFETTVSTNLPD
jgi:hypothetical protein